MLPQEKEIFKPSEVRPLLKAAVEDYLNEHGKQYDANEATNWTREISIACKERLKQLQLPNYKFIVQSVVGEMKGAGIRVGARCLWDMQCDQLAEYNYQNVSPRQMRSVISHLVDQDSMFVSVVAFGIYTFP